MGLAADIFLKRLDFPAFGNPTSPASARIFNLNTISASWPFSPCVILRGARLVDDLKLSSGSGMFNYNSELSGEIQLTVRAFKDVNLNEVKSGVDQAFELFENLLNKLKLDFITILINLKVVKAPSEQKEEKKPAKIDPKYIGKKMSRNEPCICGSGKKYKRCCGAL